MNAEGPPRCRRPLRSSADQARQYEGLAGHPVAAGYR